MQIVFLVDQYYQMVFPFNYPYIHNHPNLDNFLCAPLCLVEKVLQSSVTRLVSNVADNRYGSGYIHTSRSVCEYFFTHSLP